MKRKKSLLANVLVLALAMVLFTIPSFATSAKRTTALDLTAVTADGDPSTNIDKISSEGWKWTATTKTLTLNGFDLDVNTSSTGYAVYLPAGSTIELANTNQIKANGVDGISTDYVYDSATGVPTGDLTICGTGTLNAYTDVSDQEVIEFHGTNLLIKDCTLHLEALYGYEAIYDYEGCGSLSIQNATVTAIGKDYEEAIDMSGDINISNSTLVASSDTDAIFCGGKLTATSSKITAATSADSAIEAYGDVSFTGCKVSLTSPYCSLYAGDGVNVSISDCDFDATSTDGENFYIGYDGNMTVANSTMDLGAAYGNIYLADGNLSISGSVINAVTTDYECFYIEDNGNVADLKNSTLNLTAQDEAIQLDGPLKIENCKLNILSNGEEGIDVFGGDISIINSMGTIASDEDGIDLNEGNLLIDGSNLSINTKSDSGISVYGGLITINNSEVTINGADCGIDACFASITIKDSYVISTGAFAGIKTFSSWDYCKNQFYNGGLITIENSEIDATSTDAGFGIVSMFSSLGDITEVMPTQPTIMLNGEMVVLKGGAISSSFGMATMNFPSSGNQATAYAIEYGSRIDIPHLAAYTFTPDGETFSWDLCSLQTTNVSPVVIIRALHTLTFETNGGSYVAPLTGLIIGDTINLPADPTKDGCTFAGWYLDKELTQKLPEGAVYKRGMKVLYAAWNVTVVDEDVPKPDATKTDVPKTDVPKTSDPSNIIGISTLGMASILGVGMISRKGKVEEE